MTDRDEKFKELARLREEASLGGGKERLEKEHAKGRFTARERIDKLLDSESFVEIDEFVVHRETGFGLADNKILGDGVIIGFGTINGRKVFIFSQDFTVFGGSLAEMYGEKMVKIMKMAMTSGVPIIGLNSGAGARVQEGLKSLAS